MATSDGIEIYKSYLADVGRIGGRHEEVRKFYLSAMSALFAFLALGGPTGVLKVVQGQVVLILSVPGIVICGAWVEHMR